VTARDHGNGTNIPVLILQPLAIPDQISHHGPETNPAIPKPDYHPADDPGAVSFDLSPTRSVE